jgi:hypothetical protein
LYSTVLTYYQLKVKDHIHTPFTTNPWESEKIISPEFKQINLRVHEIRAHLSDMTTKSIPSEKIIYPDFKQINLRVHETRVHLSEMATKSIPLEYGER